MGMVIAWPGRPAGAAGRPLEDGEPRGQILFFTGVRYERHEEAGQPAPDASSKRQRAPRSRRKRA